MKTTQILSLLFLVIMSSCGIVNKLFDNPPPQVTFADFYVTTITDSSSVCVQEKVLLALHNRAVDYITLTDSIRIEGLMFNGPNMAEGKFGDEEWSIVKDKWGYPFLACLRNETNYKAIVIGTKCFKRSYADEIYFKKWNLKNKKAVASLTR